MRALHALVRFQVIKISAGGLTRCSLPSRHLSAPAGLRDNSSHTPRAHFSNSSQGPLQSFHLPPCRLTQSRAFWAICCAITASTPVSSIVKRVSKDDVELSFARSGGAGGQNVNKVNTKVDMRLNIPLCSWLSEEMKEAVMRLSKNRMNKEGELVINSTTSRSQQENVEDALRKLQDCLDAAAQSLIPIEVDPAKLKKIAKQKRAANENRLDSKKKDSRKKADRRSKPDW